MHSTPRLIAAALAGTLSAMVVIALMEALGHVLVPPPALPDAPTAQQLAEVMARMPLAAFALLFLAYALGSLAGGFVAAKLGHGHQGPVWAVATLLFLAGASNLYLLPHPLWFALASQLAYPLFTWLGGRLGRPRPAG